MKTRQQLLKIFNNAKNDNMYYSFDYFRKDCKELIKDIKKNNLYCSLYVSRSGMMRKFGFKKNYNMVLNIVYNDKTSFDSVKVGGCGMDMLWHLLYTFCSSVMTRKEIDLYSMNSKCSNTHII